MSGARSLAWRSRLVSFGWVLGFLLACRLLGTEAGASVGALAAVGLGYGHLLGAAVFARGRTESWAPAGVGPTLWRAFFAAGILSLFAAYTTVAESGLLLLVLLGISIWHTVENDLGLEQAYREGLRPGPLPRTAEPHLLAVGLAALVLAVAMSSIGPADRLLLTSTPARYVAAAPIGIGLRALSAACGLLLLARRRRGALPGLGLVAAATAVPADLSPWVSIGELFTASTLYHVVSWLVLSVEGARHLARGGSAGEARGRLRRLVWTHAVPAALCAAIAFAPVERLAGMRLVLLSPSLYLFFAALHVAHTAALRGPIGLRRAIARTISPVAVSASDKYCPGVQPR